MRAARTAVAGALLMLAAGGAFAGSGEGVIVERAATEYQPIRLVQVVAGLEFPWGLAFLPDGGMLVTERPGRLQLVRDGRKTRLQGLPDVAARNQGGLLDVALHPDYASNGWIYFTWSKEGEGERTVPALSRARLDGDRLIDLETIFESNRYTSPGRHYGSRLLFLPDGTLLMTIGDRGADPPRAQDSLDHSGSIVRLNDDGSVPADNPFVDDDEYAPEIWSWGHRNIQGITRDPSTGYLWATEHGPRGGDELNRLVAGRNYGWPDVTLGLDYRTEGPFPDSYSRDHAGQGMHPPVFEFFPTLAPSGLAVVTSERFPRWQGNLLAGGLRAERLLRLVVDGDEVLHGEELLHGRIGGIRDVRQGPDGYIYLLNDRSDGGLYRLEPAD